MKKYIYNQNAIHQENCQINHNELHINAFLNKEELLSFINTVGKNDDGTQQQQNASTPTVDIIIPKQTQDCLWPTFFNTDQHDGRYIHDIIAQRLQNVTKKRETCRILYAIQAEGYIDIDRYKSDFERAVELDKYLNKGLKPDDFRYARKDRLKR